MTPKHRCVKKENQAECLPSTLAAMKTGVSEIIAARETQQAAISSRVTRSLGCGIVEAAGRHKVDLLSLTVMEYPQCSRQKVYTAFGG